MQQSTYNVLTQFKKVKGLPDSQWTYRPVLSTFQPSNVRWWTEIPSETGAYLGRRTCTSVPPSPLEVKTGTNNGKNFLLIFENFWKCTHEMMKCTCSPESPPFQISKYATDYRKLGCRRKTARRCRLVKNSCAKKTTRKVKVLRFRPTCRTASLSDWNDRRTDATLYTSERWCNQVCYVVQSQETF